MSSKQTVRIDLYKLISRAVENGVEVGLRRAKKHTDTPKDETITFEIEQAILLELEEFIRWDDD